ncbi:MAG: hypothetical protein ACKO5K_00130 [Armatimonadota bacterium]
MKLLPFADTIPVVWILILITVSVSMHAGFVSWGAAVAGIGKRGYGRALAVTLIGGAAAATVARFGYDDAGTALAAWAVGFALQALVTSAIYRTSLRKAAAAAAVAVGSSTLFWMTVALVLWLLHPGERGTVVV